MIGRLFAGVRADVAAARDRDPAAQGVSSFDILTRWAGVQALLAHPAGQDLEGRDALRGRVAVARRGDIGPDLGEESP